MISFHRVQLCILIIIVVPCLTSFSSDHQAHPHPHHQQHHHQHLHRIRHSRSHHNFGLRHVEYDVPADVVLGENTTTIDHGPWSPWSEPSSCSRTCGGGVRSQRRYCTDADASGLSSCFGPKIRYYSCNTQPCPEPVNFRAQQCSMFNDIPIPIARGIAGKIEWEPFIHKDYLRNEICALNCKPKNGSWFVKLMDKVIDGTKCLREVDWAQGICVDGKCMPLGCDGQLGSKLVEDKCRVCGGDGRDCNTVRDVFREHLMPGYQDIVLIPKSATYIRIQELGRSRNFLAVRDAKGRYYLNGNWTFEITLSDFQAGGARFEYGKQPPTSPSGSIAESLYALGPLQEPLYIQMVYQEETPGIEYEYSVHRDVPVPSIHAPPDAYQYLLGAYGQCTRTCGSGVQRRSARCYRLKDAEFVPIALCGGQLPELTRPCNQIECPPMFRAGRWSPCLCPGLMTRPVNCEKVLADGRRMLLDNSECEGPRPSPVQSCDPEGCIKIEDITSNQTTVDASLFSDYRWNATEWTPCSSRCGPGNHSRAISCVDANDEPVDESFCPEGEKPEVEGECDDVPCEPVDWITTEWSNCTKPCASQVKTRRVACATREGKIYPNERCDADRMPSDREPCSDHVGCDYTWFTSDWSECSADCGDGVQTRFVVCGLYDDDHIKVDSSKCDRSTKPSTEQPCTSKPCVTSLYFSAWGPCHCGTNQRTGLCIDDANQTTILLGQCAAGDESLTKECVDDSVELVEESLDVVPGNETNCCETEFGCCQDRVTPREFDFSNCPAWPDNMTSSLTKDCRNSSYGCCSDGIKPAWGPFKLGCPVNCTLTRYGCCADGVTAMFNETGENCPALCLSSEFGCCDDGATQAVDKEKSNCDDGKKKKNPACPSGSDGPDCEEVEGSGEICIDVAEGSGDSGAGTCTPATTSRVRVDTSCADGLNGTSCDSIEPEIACNSTKFGCCPDGKKAKISETDDCYCSQAEFGCCPDNTTLAHGSDFQGCPCETFPYKCCQDNYSPASGPDYEGCVCSRMLYGCCPDGSTPATGPNQLGCGCIYTPYGCCPDNSTAASGPNFAGCPCRTLPHGCCPDRKTPAKGPNQEGCPCSTLTHGCCFDGVTPATGPNYAGCDCKQAPWHCCPDYQTVALGPNFEGCPGGPSLEVSRAHLACQLPRERGNCRNFTIKWHYDQSYGGCVRFWYGGCDGNANRFQSEEECEKSCVNPDGYLRCNLAKVFGACGLNVTKYYFNPETRQCETFQYSGCLGNKNNFNTRAECEAFCLHPETLDRCDQPLDPGPCNKKTQRYYFDKAEGVCKPFEWGGCGGNQNNFISQSECSQICSVAKEDANAVCYQPRSEGKCLGKYPRWYFDGARQECREFVYTGCDGNQNRFVSKDDCEKFCNSTRRYVIPAPTPPSVTVPTPSRTDTCLLPLSEGLSECYQFQVQWYYDSRWRRCMQFNYRGCGGNSNRFASREQCESFCRSNEVSSAPPSPSRPSSAWPPVDLETDVCDLPWDQGNVCSDGEGRPTLRYFYSKESQDCRALYFTGCGGNRNNFASVEECRSRCYRSEENFVDNHCLQEKNPGNGRESITAWYYDPADGVCRSFYYSGSGGNNNRFRTRKECESRCWDVQEHCFLPPVRGRCAGNYTQYYFDRNHGECKTFTYGGCEGNANRFDTLEFCQAKCNQYIKEYRRYGPRGIAN